MELLLIILLVFVIGFVILALWLLFVLFYTRVPFVKMPKENIELLLENAHITKNDIVVDLGCGDAEILIAIEKATGAQTIGYELSPIAYALAKRKISVSGVKTQLAYQNFFDADLEKATVVFIFLITGVMQKTGELLKKKLRPGTRVFSYGFDIPDWEPVAIYHSKTNSSKLYEYQIP